jgi:hypothetical protein
MAQRVSVGLILAAPRVRHGLARMILAVQANLHRDLHNRAFEVPNPSGSSIHRLRTPINTASESCPMVYYTKADHHG